MTASFRRHLATREYQLFLLGLAVMLVHLLEDALVHEENGTSLAEKLGSSALTLLLVAVGVGAYPVIWRSVRPVLVLFFGLLAFSGGWRAHATDLLAGDAAGGDYSGTVYALAGLVLVALAIKLAVDAVRGRRPPAAPAHPRADA